MLFICFCVTPERTTFGATCAKVGETLSVRIAGAFFDSLYDSDGNKLNGLLKSGDRILISLDSEFGLSSVSAGHELFHWLKQIDPQSAKRLQDIVIGIMKNDGTYEGAYSQRADAYSGYSQAEIDEEIAAQYFGVVFSSESNIRQVIENSSQQELSMWQRIVEHLKDFVKRIKDAIEKYALHDKTVRAALKADADTVEELARQFDVCLKEAAKNKKPAEQVQGGEKKSLDIKQVTLVTTGLTDEQQKILDHYGIKNLNDAAQVQINVFDTLQQNGFFTNDNNTSRIDENEASGMVIETNRSGINETFNYKNFCRNNKNIKTLKLAAVLQLPDIIKNARVIEDNVSNSKNPQSKVKYAYLMGSMQFDGIDYDVKITVRKSNEKNKFWVHHVYIKKDTAVAYDKTQKSDSSTLLTNGVEASVSQNAHAVNTNDTQNSLKDTDKASRQMSTSAERDTEYLELAKDTEKNAVQLRSLVESAARDAGYTIRAYHGTSRGDRVGNVFLPERATSGPMAFFTSSPDIAANYAKDKSDTSLAYDDEYSDYYTQFRVNRSGKSVSVVDLWNMLSFAEKTAIKNKAQHITFDDEAENIVYDESKKYGVGGFDSFGYTRASNRRIGSNQNDN